MRSGSKFGSSSTLNTCFPRCFHLFGVKFSHSATICLGVSVPPRQNLHCPFSTNPIFLRCSPSLQCPVKNPVRTLKFLLLKLIMIFYLFRSKFPSNSLACLSPGLCIHREDLLCSSPFLNFSLKNLSPSPQKGCGPVKGFAAPFLANSSAFSFPTMPLCPGIQHRVTLLRLLKTLSLCTQSQTIAELMMRELRAPMAAWLSDRICMSWFW